jgi:structural maintenance of chromosome 4
LTRPRLARCRQVGECRPASLNKLKARAASRASTAVGDLGVIDEKYDVAVTTCSALNNLVVDTVEQGQACIEHLRKGNVGRASFMVLDKLPPRDLSRIETPEGVPRLFDLIKPKDPKFAPAFYKGVFNTLVADDLQQAQRIGYGKKRWRVVTLAGQLIDPSGTMSGGGTRVARGGMNSKFVADKVAPEVVHGYEKECHAAEEKPLPPRLRSALPSNRWHSFASAYPKSRSNWRRLSSTFRLDQAYRGGREASIRAGVSPPCR